MANKRLNPAVEAIALRKENEQLRKDNYIIKGFTLQQAMDIALVTLHRHFGFGPERGKQFHEAFRQEFYRYAQMCVDDSKDDDQIWYTKEKLDGALRDALGDDIIPFEERYQLENLYTLDTAKNWRDAAKR